MNKFKRFDMFCEKHIGFGIRWDHCLFPFELSIAIMCVTIVIGFGKERG